MHDPFARWRKPRSDLFRPEKPRSEQEKSLEIKADPTVPTVPTAKSEKQAGLGEGPEIGRAGKVTMEGNTTQSGDFGRNTHKGRNRSEQDFSVQHTESGRNRSERSEPQANPRASAVPTGKVQVGTVGTARTTPADGPRLWCSPYAWDCVRQDGRWRHVLRDPALYSSLRHRLVLDEECKEDGDDRQEGSER